MLIFWRTGWESPNLWMPITGRLAAFDEASVATLAIVLKMTIPTPFKDW